MEMKYVVPDMAQSFGTLEFAGESEPIFERDKNNRKVIARRSLKNNIGLKFAFRSTDINEINAADIYTKIAAAVTQIMIKTIPEYKCSGIYFLSFLLFNTIDIKFQSFFSGYSVPFCVCRHIRCIASKCSAT